MADLTPNKRKRERELYIDNDPNKENAGFTFTNVAFMEVKSLADIAHQHHNSNVRNQQLENPFEVYRKPHKKIRKRVVDEQCCFANPALNINAPEHVVNPYEIKRTNFVSDGMCFENTALNIVDQQQSAELNDAAPTITRAIGVPFTPTIGCRINFNDVPLESLTPCSMLTSKLKLSTPRAAADRVAAATMSVISEESLDIDAELDCYQLQLENSINEAKQGSARRQRNDQPAAAVRKRIMMKNIPNFTKRLNDELMNPSSPQPTQSTTSDVKSIDDNDELNEKLSDVNESVEDAEDDFDDDSFQNHQPAFVRTFRQKSIRKPATVVDGDGGEHKKSNDGIATKSTNTIRESLRKGFHFIMPQSKKSSSSSASVPSLNNADGGDGPTNIFTTIRQSLRRKKTEPMTTVAHHDLSVMVETERKVFKQFPANDSKSVTKEKGAGGDALNRKKSLRSSFRNSSKDVRRHVRHMFTKNLEEYEFHQ